MGGTDLKKLQNLVNDHLKTGRSSKKFVGTIYSDIEGTGELLSYFKEIYQGKVDRVAALEGSGYILGGMLARELGVGFVPITKHKNRDDFQDDCYYSVYVNHDNESSALVVRKDSLGDHSRVLVVDNWVKTGATIHCIRAIMEDAGSEVVGIAAFGMDDNERTRAIQAEISVSSIL